MAERDAHFGEDAAGCVNIRDKTFVALGEDYHDHAFFHGVLKRTEEILVFCRDVAHSVGSNDYCFGLLHD